MSDKNVVKLFEKTCCNICGKELDIYDKEANYHIHTKMSYGSKYDMSEIDIHICTECLDNMIDNCVKSPIADEESDLY